MSEFLGSRISLISKSDIRYVGTLHEINSEASTVSLENVRSWGTEGRKKNQEEEVQPSDQVYEYIVFRGTDVKDLRIEEGPGAVKENKPPTVPDDPAIVGGRPHPGIVQPEPLGPLGPPGPANRQGPPAPGFGYYAPQPQMAGWDRDGGPGPNGFGGMPPYPPPQWYPGPAQRFPPGPPSMGWNYPYPPGPGVFPGAPAQGNLHGPGSQNLNNIAPGQSQSQAPASYPAPSQTQMPKALPFGSATEKEVETPSQPSGTVLESKFLGRPPQQTASTAAPLPPVESRPSEEEVKARAASFNKSAEPGTIKSSPRGSQGGRPSQILPAVPLPVALTQRQTTQAHVPTEHPSAAAIRDATQAAKAAVAIAMAKLDASSTIQAGNGSATGIGTAMDNLTRKVDEMRINNEMRITNNATRPGPTNRGGRGRGTRYPVKMGVPDADFDFASSNAKFNRGDLIKQAIAGSPLNDGPHAETARPESALDGAVPVAYNKSRSFFDNISSETRDRLENNGQKPGGREWRGEEQRKNMETFGQSSVDGGHRAGRGGRGRKARGGYRARGGNRGPRDPALPVDR